MPKFNRLVQRNLAVAKPVVRSAVGGVRSSGVRTGFRAARGDFALTRVQAGLACVRGLSLYDNSVFPMEELMSEYQCIAFRAIDGPVSPENLTFMRKQSTRAEVTPWSFDNEYSY